MDSLVFSIIFCHLVLFSHVINLKTLMHYVTHALALTWKLLCSLIFTIFNHHRFSLLIKNNLILMFREVLRMFVTSVDHVVAVAFIVILRYLLNFIKSFPRIFRSFTFQSVGDSCQNIRETSRTRERDEFDDFLPARFQKALLFGKKSGESSQ